MSEKNVHEEKDMFIRDLYIDWDKIGCDSYLRQIDSLKYTNSLHFSKPVVFFTGENGSGKSTLLEAMAIVEGLNPEGGSKNYMFSTYDSHSELFNAVSLSRSVTAEWKYFLRAESFYNVLTAEAEYEGRPQLHNRSHGEGFLEVIQNKMHGEGLFFLDEPDSALSPQRQLTLITEIYRSVRSGSQFFIATNSPLLLGCPEAEIWTFDDGPVHQCAYEDTSSYKVTSMFLNDRRRIVDLLIRP